MQSVVLVDISLDGAKIEHREPVKTGADVRLTFNWDDEPVDLKARVTRCKLERFSGGSDGLTIYNSGLHFHEVGDAASVLRRMVSVHISRALDEQKANARGVLPVSVDHMPIFRGHTLTANPGEAAEGVELYDQLPAARIARTVGYLCYRLDRNSWKRTRTDDPEQPLNGFTVSASEDLAQIEQLCETYRKADEHGRELIRTLARLSIADGDSADAGRFHP